MYDRCSPYTALYEKMADRYEGSRVVTRYDRSKNLKEGVLGNDRKSYEEGVMTRRKLAKYKVGTNYKVVIIISLVPSPSSCSNRLLAVIYYEKQY